MRNGLGRARAAYREGCGGARRGHFKARTPCASAHRHPVNRFPSHLGISGPDRSGPHAVSLCRPGRLICKRRRSRCQYLPDPVGHSELSQHSVCCSDHLKAVSGPHRVSPSRRLCKPCQLSSLRLLLLIRRTIFPQDLLKVVWAGNG